MSASGEIPLPWIADGHVHVGMFDDRRYFSPAYVARALREVGVSRFAVSSTTSIAGPFESAEQELRALVSLTGGAAVPLLWLTPRVARDLATVDLSLYRGLKVHPFAESWAPDDPLLEQGFDLARRCRWPVLVHTGWTPESEAGRFTPLYERFSDVDVVLAHGRPHEQTVELLRALPRVWVDTAYMPLAQVRNMVETVGEHRIVFGSDFPIDRHYFPRASATRRYRRRIEALGRCFGTAALRRWASDNFDMLHGRRA